MRATARWSVVDSGEPVAVSVPLDKGVPTLLQLDDGSWEADVGFTAAAAFQFLWFNRFAPPAPGRSFALEEIHVLFPAGPGIVPGAAVQLALYSDSDGDPANGAFLVGTYDEVIQVADGVTFSVYPLVPPLPVYGSADLLVGVVNRFVVSGVSPPSRPAALDTTVSAGRSWVALWSGDPPDPPALPSDDTMTTIDDIEPGNWMIRVAGAPLPVVVIPALDRAGLVALAALLALAGLVMTVAGRRRRTPRPRSR